MASSWSILRRVGLGANLAVVAGQAQIRLQAMGTDYHRDATETEIAAMEGAPQRGHGWRRAGAESGPGL